MWDILKCRNSKALAELCIDKTRPCPPPLAQIKSHRYTKAHLAILFVHSRTDPGWHKGPDRQTARRTQRRGDGRSVARASSAPRLHLRLRCRRRQVRRSPSSAAHRPLQLVARSIGIRLLQSASHNSPIPNPQSPISKIQHHPHSGIRQEGNSR